jgi:hypothetical protein
MQTASLHGTNTKVSPDTLLLIGYRAFGSLFPKVDCNDYIY